MRGRREVEWPEDMVLGALAGLTTLNVGIGGKCEWISKAGGEVRD